METDGILKKLWDIRHRYSVNTPDAEWEKMIQECEEILKHKPVRGHIRVMVKATLSETKYRFKMLQLVRKIPRL